MERILVLVRKPPYGTEEAFAGLRCGLSLQASGEVTAADVVLMEEGTYNCLPGQQPEAALAMPSNPAVLEELAALGILVWAVASDCRDRNLDPEKLDWGVEALSEAELPELMEAYDGVACF